MSLRKMGALKMLFGGPSAQSARRAARPAVPDVLIHLHIPKTGGTSLNSMMQHGFRNDEVLDISIDIDEFYCGLGIATYEHCQERLASYSRDDLARIRYATGHLPMGLHSVFDRPAKYFTVIRHPVDRVISHFYYLIQENRPFLKDGRLLTFEEYVESARDIYLRDYQVRLVSGCPELDVERREHGLQTPGASVERRHLDAAKRNIEKHFLAAAPLERMIELTLLTRGIYGWPLRRLLTEYKGRTRRRPLIRDVSPHLIKIMEECNSYDLELYEWVQKRFEDQCKCFEPELSRDRRIFEMMSRAVNASGQLLPRSVRKRLAQMLFYA